MMWRENLFKELNIKLITDKQKIKNIYYYHRFERFEQRQRNILSHVNISWKIQKDNLNNTSDLDFRLTIYS